MDPILKKALVEYIVGERKEVTISGSSTVIGIIYEAAKSSRKLYESLESGDINQVKIALDEKRIAVERYERIFGFSWDI